MGRVKIKAIIDAYHKDSRCDGEIDIKAVTDLIAEREKRGGLIHCTSKGLISGEVVKEFKVAGMNRLNIDFFYILRKHRNLKTLRYFLGVAEVYAGLVNNNKKVINSISFGFGMYDQPRKLLRQALAMRRYGYKIADVTVHRKL